MSIRKDPILSMTALTSGVCKSICHITVQSVFANSLSNNSKSVKVFPQGLHLRNVKACPLNKSNFSMKTERKGLAEEAYLNTNLGVCKAHPLCHCHRCEGRQSHRLQMQSLCFSKGRNINTLLCDIWGPLPTNEGMIQ